VLLPGLEVRLEDVCGGQALLLVDGGARRLKQP
jgi:hypothetical protein